MKLLFVCMLLVCGTHASAQQRPKVFRHHYHSPIDSLVMMNANSRTLSLPWAPRDRRHADGRIGFMEDRRSKLIRHWVLAPQDHITFYVDTLIAQPWRDAIKEGLTRWNVAFREIGLGDVVEARDLPPLTPRDSVNLVRFIDADRPNAQGVFWFDPRSGEIGRGEIFWWRGVMKKLRLWLFTQLSASCPAVRQGIADSLLAEAVAYSAAHEMGHVLGLKHNMRASFAIPTDSLRSPSFTQRHGTTASIMDYARFNFVAQPGDVERGVYLFPPHLGEYDRLAIRYAYGAPAPHLLDSIAGNDMLAYTGNTVTARPTDPSAQSFMLGNDILKSTQYAVKNMQLTMAHLDEWLPDSMVFTREEAVGELADFYCKLTYLCLANIGGHYRDSHGHEVQVSPKRQQATRKFLRRQLRSWRSWLPETKDMLKWEKDIKKYI